MKGEANYKDSYQDLGRIACFSDVIYNYGKDEAQVDIKCRKHSSISSLEYSFDEGKSWTSNSLYDAHDEKDFGILKIHVRDSNKKYLIKLEDLDFVWNAPQIH